MDRKIKELIAKYAAGELSDTDCKRVERRAQEDPEIARELDRALQPVAAAFRKLYPPVAIDASRSRQIGDQATSPGPRGWSSVAARARNWCVLKPLRIAGLSGVASAGLAFGMWFAAPSITAWRFPGGQAMPVWQEVQRRIDRESQSTLVPSDHVGPWKIEGSQLPPGFATFDRSVSHSGGPSLRLLQRWGSGKLSQTLPIPLPAGTQVTFGAWVFAPRGGSARNKYFAMFVESPDSGNEASVDILDASPAWRPYLLKTVLAKPVRSPSLILSMSDGYGKYTGSDWATWVDDVFVGDSMPLSGTCRLVRGSLIIDASMPGGFDASKVDPDSIRFWASYDDENSTGIPGRIIPGPDHKTIRVVIDSPKAAAKLNSGNKDTQGPATGAVWGRVQYGPYSVPFKISITGPVSDLPMRVGQARDGA